MRDLSPIIDCKVGDFLKSLLHCALSGHLTLINPQKGQRARITLHRGLVTDVEYLYEAEQQLPVTNFIDALCWPNASYEWVEAHTSRTDRIFPKITEIHVIANNLQQSLKHTNFSAGTCKQYIDMRRAFFPFTMVCTHSTGKTFECLIENEIAVFGQDETAHISLEDTEISPSHTKLKINQNGMWLTDLGSKTGTKINDLKILPHDLFPFTFKDQLTLGRYQIKPSTETILKASLYKNLAARELRLLTRKSHLISNLDLKQLISRHKMQKKMQEADTTLQS
ncbi:MAG: FHA domain-containing protein [Verrucomicrobiota bacterium]